MEDPTLALTQSLRSDSTKTVATVAIAGPGAEPEPTPGPDTQSRTQPRRHRPDVRVGRYRLVSVLGEGGMGTVYSAHDDELARPVALKLLRTSSLRRSSSATGGARDRMLREAQAMAQLSHPNVVQVYDVGVHAGEVFIAMELVRGRTLSAWTEALGEPVERCRRWREIVEIYVEAGRGLAAAHAVGLVHRDFKPQNVLVGDDGGVRVLDFGLARVEHEHLSRQADVDEEALSEVSTSKLHEHMTMTGTLLGTPAYFSPEQVRAEPATAASDQFSFCVSLHEALTGVRPYGGSTFSELAANVRHGVRSSLPRGVALPGWLREVIDRGLAIEPEQRWPSIDELLAALLDDPARRRRRRLALALAGLLAVGIAGGVWAHDSHQRATCEALGDAVLAAWSPQRREQLAAAFVASGVAEPETSWRRIEADIDRWTSSWREARVHACVETDEPGVDAQLRARCLERQRWQLESLVDALGTAERSAVYEAPRAVAELPPVERCSDPVRLAAETWTGDDALDSSGEAQQVLRDLSEVMVLDRLGRSDEALALAESARDRAAGLGDRVHAEALTKLGLVRAGRADYVGAQTDLNAAYLLAGSIDHDRLAATCAIELARVVGGGLARPDEGRRWLAFARMHTTSMGLDPNRDEPELFAVLGDIEDRSGRYAEALAAHARALELRDELLDPDHPDRAESLTRLADLERRLGDYASALGHLERAREILEQAFGAEHPALADIHEGLGGLDFDLGRPEQALRDYQRAVSILEATTGPDDPRLAIKLGELGAALQRLGRHRDALASFERALELCEAAYGGEHPSVAAALSNIALTKAHLGRGREAAADLRAVLAIEEAALGPDHATLAATHYNLGLQLEQLGDHEAALAHYERAMAIDEVALGRDHPTYAGDLDDVGRMRLRLGQPTRALELHQRALEIRAATLPDDHPARAASHDHLGAVALATGDPEAALAHHQAALAIHDRLDPDHERSASTLLNLGAAWLALGRPDQALQSFERARTILAGLEGEPPPRLAEALEGSAQCRARLGDHARAAELREQASALRERLGVGLP